MGRRPAVTKTRDLVLTSSCSSSMDRGRRPAVTKTRDPVLISSCSSSMDRGRRPAVTETRDPVLISTCSSSMGRGLCHFLFFPFFLSFVFCEVAQVKSPTPCKFGSDRIYEVQMLQVYRIPITRGKRLWKIFLNDDFILC